MENYLVEGHQRNADVHGQWALEYNDLCNLGDPQTANHSYPSNTQISSCHSFGLGNCCSYPSWISASSGTWGLDLQQLQWLLPLQQQLLLPVLLHFLHLLLLLFLPNSASLVLGGCATVKPIELPDISINVRGKPGKVK